MHLEETQRKQGYRLSDHPWAGMLVLQATGILVLVLVIIAANLAGVPGDAPYRPLVTPGLAHVLVLFVIAPFVLRLPNGRRTFREYLHDIRLSRLRPFIPLLVLGISSSLLMLLALSANALVYRLAQGLPFSGSFLRNLIDIKSDLPPASLSYIASLPSIFEEVSWRGVVLALFMRRYSARTSVLVTALGFGLIHFINLLFGTAPDFVIRQVIMGTALGLFYGYMVLRTDSLLPAMLFHYLVNMFIGSFTWYFQRQAPVGTQVLYTALNLALSVPLLVLWVRFFCERWIPGPAGVQSRILEVTQ